MEENLVIVPSWSIIEGQKMVQISGKILNELSYNNLNSNITYKLFYFLVLVLFLRVDLSEITHLQVVGAHIVAIDTFIKEFIQIFKSMVGLTISLVDILYTIFISLPR